MFKPIALVVTAVLTPTAVSAQEQEEIMWFEEAEEISLARSAAPAEVSAEATIYVLRNGHYEIAVEGTNNVSCMVSRSEVVSMEPICYDEEGSWTMLPMEIFLVEQQLAGVPREEVDLQIAHRLGTGEFRSPKRPSMAYMMSSRQILYDQGQRVGAWRPHLMIYYPFITNTDIGMPEGAFATAGVRNPGKPNATIVIPVADFIDPEGM